MLLIPDLIPALSIAIRWPRNASATTSTSSIGVTNRQTVRRKIERLVIEDLARLDVDAFHRTIGSQ